MFRATEHTHLCRKFLTLYCVKSVKKYVYLISPFSVLCEGLDGRFWWLFEKCWLRISYWYFSRSLSGSYFIDQFYYIMPANVLWKKPLLFSSQMSLFCRLFDHLTIFVDPYTYKLNIASSILRFIKTNFQPSLICVIVGVCLV